MSVNEKEWYIQAPWGRISIVAWGDCYDPPVLLCHGSMDSAVTFRPLVNHLPKNFYYIGIELPGHGKSDWFPPGLMISVYDLVYAIEAVVKHFRWEKFVFIGHSLGAVVGKFYNISYPRKISKLVELDPIDYHGVPPESFSKWYEKYFIQFYENYEKFNLPKEKAAIHKRNQVVETLKKERGFSEKLAVTSLERCSESAGDGLIRYTFDPRSHLINGPPFSPEHIKTIFTAVNTPMLGVIADKSLEMGLFGNTTFLIDEKSYPAGNFRTRVVPGGHNVHTVNPESVAMFVSQFVLHGIEGLDSKAKL